ncbi:(Fe-S)-binding protein [Thermostilla marina]
MNEADIRALPRWEYPPYERGEKVALFIPCYIDQFFPKIAKDTAEILTRLGVPVEFPEEQTCCGQPAFNSGYWDEARRVIRHFCDVFRPYRYIVTPSGSCAAMARVFFGQADPDEAVTSVGARVFELTEFLVEILGVVDLGARYPHAVTMHSGCHGRRELGIYFQPLRLLEHVKDLDYRELPNIEECCGFGGTFSVKMAGTSLAMGKTKAEYIASTGAEVVTSVDISCLMHVGGVLRKDPAKRHIRTVHIAEILNSR